MPTESLDVMVNEAPGPIDFTIFLPEYSEKLKGIDPEDIIRNAFAHFDEEATGTIQEEHLRDLLSLQMGKSMNCPRKTILTKRKVNYSEFSHICKRGSKRTDD